MPSITPLRALLIDSNSVDRNRLARSLRDDRVCVEECVSIAESQKALRSDGFSFAAVEMQLVDGHGLGLVRLLERRVPPLPTVVVTGYPSVATAIASMRLGVLDYLVKPVQGRDVIAAALRQEAAHLPEPSYREARIATLEWVEWEHINRAVAKCGGNISRAARLLGMYRQSLQRKLWKRPLSADRCQDDQELRGAGADQALLAGGRNTRR